MPGFSHSQSTPFGTATFWQVGKISIALPPNPTLGNASMIITMIGWSSQADAYAGAYQPLGEIQLPLGPAQIAAFFSTAQANITAFIESVWPDATYLTP